MRYRVINVRTSEVLRYHRHFRDIVLAAGEIVQYACNIDDRWFEVKVERHHVHCPPCRDTFQEQVWANDN